METLSEFIFAGLLAIGSFILSVMQFREKGICMNTAYLFASSKERKQMNKKLHYRQFGVVFAFLTVIFLCLAAEIMWNTGWLLQVIRVGQN